MLLVRNFLPNRSNFLNRFGSVQFNQVGKGVDTLGGLPPPRRGRAHYTLHHLLTLRLILALGSDVKGLHRQLLKQNLKGTS